MNILIVHNRYQQAGGEDVVVAAEAALLAGAGHQVHTEIVSNDTIEGVPAKARAFMAAPYDRSRLDWMDRLLERTGADLVHVHNFFPRLTPAIHHAASARGVAVVQTLHNYRLLCAGATLLRHGTICEKCVGGSPLWGVVHRCYRGSLPGSLAVVAMQQLAARERTWHRDVHRFIALTDFARQKFIAGGLPAARIATKPNFVGTSAVPHGPRSGALFVGRLTPEKGLDVLLDAWRSLPDIVLTVVGDGPERDRLMQKAPANVRFLGALPAKAVAAQMGAASAVLVPSIWYEGMPMTIVEAFAAGTPVIASELGAMAEIVGDGADGVLLPPGDAAALASAVRAAFAEPRRLAGMGRAARQTYEGRYTPALNLVRLEAIYAEALTLAQP